MIEPGEIVHCNITLLTAKKKVVVVNEIVFAREYEGEMKTKYTMVEDGGYIKNRFGLDEDVTITKIDVIKSMGYKVKDFGSSLGFSAAEKNERQANGTY